METKVDSTQCIVTLHLVHVMYVLLYSDDEGEGGIGSGGLTQEIDLAVERVMSSMMSSPGVGSRGCIRGAGEEFPPENLNGWEMNTTPGIFSA